MLVDKLLDQIDYWQYQTGNRVACPKYWKTTWLRRVFVLTLPISTVVLTTLWMLITFTLFILYTILFIFNLVVAAILEIWEGK